MLNSTTLEVAIGMAFIYLLLSLFCTAINEAIAGILGSRATNLEKGIKSLFTDGLKKKAEDNGSGTFTPPVTLAEAIYNHGLIQSLYRSTATEKASIWFGKIGSHLPSYIPTHTFTSALLDVLFPGDTVASSDQPRNLATMLAELDKLPESKGKEAIVTLVKQAGGNMAATRRSLEGWYNDGMDRAAGWYKRKTQIVLFFIGITVAVGLNVDSITIGRTLWISPAIRSYSVAAAEDYAKLKSTPTADAAKDLSVLQSLALPVGWNSSKLPWIDEQGTGATYYATIFTLEFTFRHRRLDAYRDRDDAGSSLLVRPPQSVYGDTFDDKAAREERCGSIKRP